MTTTLKALDGGTRSLTSADLTALDIALDGDLLHPGDAGFDTARTVWNGMIDRRPGLVVRAANVRDIQAAVNFARENGVLLAVRSGGHQIAGLAVADGALLLDLSAMNAVTVDPEMRAARVEPGAPPRRRGRGDAEVRPHRAARHQLHHRHRRAHPRRRLRLDHPQVRPDHRQPRRRRRRHRRRGPRPRQRRARTRTSSGRSAAAAATSAWSRPSSSACTASARTSSPASSSTR